MVALKKWPRNNTNKNNGKMDHTREWIPIVLQRRGRGGKEELTKSLRTLTNKGIGAGQITTQ